MNIYLILKNKINKRINKIKKNHLVLLIKNRIFKPKVDMINFWDTKVDDLWLTKFIKKINYTNNVIFISIMDKKRKYLKYYYGKKIFFTGENLNVGGIVPVYNDEYRNNMIDEVDLSLGFDYLDNEKYVRFPLWYMYLFEDMKIGYDEIKEKIEKLNRVENRKTENRKGFATLISRHDLGGQRFKIYNLLKDIGNIQCAGKFLNNTKELKEMYNDNKIEYMRNFKFNICPENSNSKGYVTEKIFQSIISGCIPIYWGGGVAP